MTGRPERFSASEGAAGDLLAAYLAVVPRDLSATAWARWRGKNPPPCVCGGELGRARFCHACHRRELGEDWQIFFARAAAPDPCPAKDSDGNNCDGRRVLGSTWCARCSDKKRGDPLEGQS